MISPITTGPCAASSRVCSRHASGVRLTSTQSKAELSLDLAFRRLLPIRSSRCAMRTSICAVCQVHPSLQSLSLDKEVVNAIITLKESLRAHEVLKENEKEGEKAASERLRNEGMSVVLSCSARVPPAASHRHVRVALLSSREVARRDAAERELAVHVIDGDDDNGGGKVGDGHAKKPKAQREGKANHAHGTSSQAATSLESRLVDALDRSTSAQEASAEQRVAAYSAFTLASSSFQALVDAQRRHVELQTRLLEAKLAKRTKASRDHAEESD